MKGDIEGRDVARNIFVLHQTGESDAVGNTAVLRALNGFGARRTVSNDMKMQIEAWIAVSDEVDDARQSMPLANEAGKAENQFAGESECHLGLISRRNIGKRLGIDAIGNNNDTLIRNADGTHVIGKNVGYRQNAIGTVPDRVLGSSGQPGQGQAVMGGTFEQERSVDFRKHRQSGASLEPHAGRQVQIVALVQTIGLVRIEGALEALVRSHGIGKFDYLVHGLRQVAL